MLYQQRNCRWETQTLVSNKQVLLCCTPFASRHGKCGAQSVVHGIVFTDVSQSIEIIFSSVLQLTIFFGMMTTPQLSAPIIFAPSDLEADPALIYQITKLCNDAFRRSKEQDPEKWSARPRFETPQKYEDMLDDESVVAIIFDRGGNGNQAVNGDQQKEGATEGSSRGKVVACAAAVPWKGGWAKEGASTEDGFEIKAICVDRDAKYLRRGLAIQLMDCLQNHLIQLANSRNRDHGENCASGTGLETDEKRARLTLWILAAECINGVYWRKRGYREVRRTTEGAGTWGCQTSFDMVVLRKVVTYNLEA
jgi:hypothetical protein